MFSLGIGFQRTNIVLEFILFASSHCGLEKFPENKIFCHLKEIRFHRLAAMATQRSWARILIKPVFLWVFIHFILFRHNARYTFYSTMIQTVLCKWHFKNAKNQRSFVKEHCTRRISSLIELFYKRSQFLLWSILSSKFYPYKMFSPTFVLMWCLYIHRRKPCILTNPCRYLQIQIWFGWFWTAYTWK